MAYTQNIDETTPAGTDDAKTADDELRNLKRDIKERLVTFFDDINNDPMYAKTPLIINSSGGAGNVEVRIAGTNYGLIGMDATKKYLHNGNLPIQLPVQNPVPAAGAGMNNCIIMDDSTGQLVIYANNLRYRVTAVAF